MNENFTEPDEMIDEDSLGEAYGLLLVENGLLKQKLSTMAAIIDGIADDHEEVMDHENLTKIIENQAATINELKSFLARKQDSSLFSFVLSLVAKNSMLNATVLNCIARNTELHRKLIEVLDAESKSIL